VIYGNYDTYEHMRSVTATGPTGEGPAARPAEKGGVRQRDASDRATKPRRKRRFPYRKIEDIEADIALQETHLRELETLLASPDLYRDGEKVKETTRAFQETRTALSTLYEHWEEAVELN